MKALTPLQVTLHNISLSARGPEVAEDGTITIKDGYNEAEALELARTMLPGVDLVGAWRAHSELRCEAPCG